MDSVVHSFGETVPCSLEFLGHSVNQAQIWIVTSSDGPQKNAAILQRGLVWPIHHKLIKLDSLTHHLALLKLPGDLYVSVDVNFMISMLHFFNHAPKSLDGVIPSKNPSNCIV
uniref:Uncharacterized protein n=1 Tax=Cucumis sativus TaxID=3659 RepID=A0A0A0LU70_CUCSA